MAMANRVLIYGFPLFLWFMEWLLRLPLQNGPTDFLAPTIAAAGLGLLLPLTAQSDWQAELKKVTVREIGILKLVVKKMGHERLFIESVWVGILVSVAAWAICVVTTCRPELLPFKWPHIYSAVGIYTLAVALGEIKVRL
jgi:hypothetical protein